MTRTLALHGTRSKYTRGCRCDDCRKANRIYKEASRRAGGMRPQAEVSLEMLMRSLPCGTTAAYSRGCRCQWCRRANAAYHRARFHEQDPERRRMPSRAVSRA